MPVSARARRRQERAWPQWPGPSRPFASPASGKGIGAPISTIPLPRCRSASTASSRVGHHPQKSQCYAGILPPYALRAGRAGCDSLCPDKRSTKSQEPSLRGKPTACYTWPLFLHTSAVVNHAGSVPGAQDAAVPAAGAESVGYLPQRGPFITATPCAGTPASATLRCVSTRLTVPVSEDRHHPHQPCAALTPLGRPGQPPLRSGFLVTGRLIVGPRNPHAHILPAMRLPATKADQGHTPQPQCVIRRHHPPGGREQGINIYHKEQWLTPLPLCFCWMPLYPLFILGSYCFA